MTSETVTQKVRQAPTLRTSSGQCSGAFQPGDRMTGSPKHHRHQPHRHQLSLRTDPCQLPDPPPMVRRSGAAAPSRTGCSVRAAALGARRAGKAVLVVPGWSAPGREHLDGRWAAEPARLWPVLVLGPGRPGVVVQGQTQRWPWWRGRRVRCVLEPGAVCVTGRSARRRGHGGRSGSPDGRHRVRRVAALARWAALVF